MLDLLLDNRKSCLSVTKRTNSKRRSAVNNKKSLQQVLILILAVLFVAGCSTAATSTPTPTPLPKVTGTITNQANNEPLVGARVVLCQLVGAKTCTVLSDVTAIADADGKFVIPDVDPGKYIVLYNSSGERQAKWSDLKIDFAPVQLEESESITWGIVDSVGVETSICDFGLVLTGLGSTAESGILFFKDLDLALELVENDPISIDVQKETAVNLSVWSTQDEECDTVIFHPAVQRLRAMFAETEAEGKVNFIDLEFEIVSKTSECVAINVTGRAVIKDGDQVVPATVKELSVFVRQDSGWEHNPDIESCD
jgi:hypothetical protein